MKDLFETMVSLLSMRKSSYQFAMCPIYYLSTPWWVPVFVHVSGAELGCKEPVLAPAHPPLCLSGSPCPSQLSFRSQSRLSHALGSDTALMLGCCSWCAETASVLPLSSARPLPCLCETTAPSLSWLLRVCVPFWLVSRWEAFSVVGRLCFPTNSLHLQANSLRLAHRCRFYKYSLQEHMTLEMDDHKDYFLHGHHVELITEELPLNF